MPVAFRASGWSRTASTAARAILYVHGGGYVIGSLDTHRPLVGAALRRGTRVLLNVDYRLAPEHPHPAAVEDAVAAYRWLLAQGSEARVDRHRG